MRLPLAAAVKFTENGKQLQLDEGLWTNAGAVKFKQSLFDTQQCGTVTQAVVPAGSTDVPLALRLALEFRMFPMGGCNLSSDCKRMENGFTLACSVGATCADGDPSGSAVMKPRIILADVEAGLAAGFTMFQGRYSDVHMIKYSGGKVHGVHTILGKADSSGWD